MAKFIKIKDRLINVDKVQEFKLDGRFIYAFYRTDDYAIITCADEHEATFIFEDIPHLIDNDHIPAWVRKHNEARMALSAADYNWNDDPGFNELPF